MNQPLLSLKNVTIQFGEKILFQNLNWQAERGEFISFLGPSGSGKSTLLRLFAGLLPPTSGEVFWNFNSGSDKSPSTGFVFQESELLPWRNVLENTLLPFELQPKTQPRNLKQLSDRAREVLNQLGLKDSAHALYPHQISGGMKMRVSIARALVAKPEVIFMDEPFAALDEAARFRLQNEFRKLTEQEKLTVFFITHSTYEAAFLSDRIVTVSNLGPSQLQADERIVYSVNREEALRESPEYLEQVHKLRVRTQKGDL